MLQRFFLVNLFILNTLLYLLHKAAVQLKKLSKAFKLLQTVISGLLLHLHVMLLSLQHMYMQHTLLFMAMYFSH